MVNVEDRWKVLKEVVIASVEKNVGYQNTQTARKPWVTDVMISKMEERRKWKNVRVRTKRVIICIRNSTMS